MDDVTIRANFAVAETDIAAFAVQAALDVPGYQARARRTLTAAIGLLFVALGAGVAIGQRGTRQSVFGFIAFAAIGSLCASNFYSAYPRRLARRVRDAYVREPSPTLLGVQSLLVDRDGVTVANQHCRSEYKWSSITRVTQTPAHIFLHLGPAGAIIVRKDSLNGASPEAVVQAIGARIGRSLPADRADVP